MTHKLGKDKQQVISNYINHRYKDILIKKKSCNVTYIIFYNKKGLYKSSEKEEYFAPIIINKHLTSELSSYFFPFIYPRLALEVHPLLEDKYILILHFFAQLATL